MRLLLESQGLCSVASKADFRGIRRWFKPAVAAAGITGFPWHGLRHTYCSWLAMAGACIREIQIVAGQRSISASARYAQLGHEQVSSVINRFAFKGHPEGDA